ncbi:hypothetical protein GDI0708 [Gluconacetobacter diazotrophicus PA1 5]|uniref:Uncharacterized protein n=1 Tax=Gluconacetobacter diazotrophicus (strain ATCC 49037 / DSM 5601 / CCUG 37298 / CIP 103539 / LMG 7603 / PAl5) TaxID=272568 RepID=A9H9C6_GLUDA|nr:hypothetical protein GDI0708 [Gluconacetobacter diazotrophicus PA1 5]
MPFLFHNRCNQRFRMRLMDRRPSFGFSETPDDDMVVVIPSLFCCTTVF